MNTALPTPLEILLDPISLSILAIYAGLMICETIAPAKKLPEIRGWKLRGMISFVAYFYLSSYLPLFTDEYLVQYQLFDLTDLGTWGGVVVGVLILEFGTYVWHRTMHGSNILWRSFHQMHHSAERLDTYGTFYFSPLDMVGLTLLGSVCLVLGVGITAEAAALVLIITTLMAIFTHTNVSTPRWLGYIIQRPESHSIHHGRGVHAGNYCELPIYDMLFGTFENPKEFVEHTGFYEGASKRIGDMLMFQDVSQPAEVKEQAVAKTAAA